MIYLLQEFHGGKWWLVQPFVNRFHADEQLKYLEKKDPYGAYRIKEFELPEKEDD